VRWGLRPGVPGNLADPSLELRDARGMTLASNDNWVDSPDKQAIMATGLAPPNPLEPAILYTLLSNNAQLHRHRPRRERHDWHRTRGSVRAGLISPLGKTFDLD
jgi:hypothetical protein